MYVFDLASDTSPSSFLRGNGGVGYPLIGMGLGGVSTVVQFVERKRVVKRASCLTALYKSALPTTAREKIAMPSSCMQVR